MFRVYLRSERYKKALLHAACGPVLFLVSLSAMSGDWGREEWGYMYWGEWEASAPLIQPDIRSVRESELRFEVFFRSYDAGDDGWSLIRGYDGDCDDDVVVSLLNNSALAVQKRNGSPITCNFWAINAFGRSAIRQVTFDSASIIHINRIFYDGFSKK